MSSQHQVILVQSGDVATLVVPADGIQTCLVNSDAANTLYLGDTNSIQAGDPNNTTPLNAGNNVTYDGTQEVYANAPAGTTIAVLVYPTGSNATQSPQSPASTPPMVSSQSIGSGNTVHLIGTVQNPKRYAAQILSLSISSASDGDGTNNFALEDVITDTTGIQYLANEVKSNAVSSVSMDMKGVVMPAGATLNLVNGGDAGAGGFRRCSATVIYYLQN